MRQQKLPMPPPHVGFGGIWELGKLLVHREIQHLPPPVQKNRKEKAGSHQIRKIHPGIPLQNILGGEDKSEKFKKKENKL